MIWCAPIAARAWPPGSERAIAGRRLEQGAGDGERRDVLATGIPRLEIAREVQQPDGGPPAETVGGLREVMWLDSFGERQGVLLDQRAGAANPGLTPVRAKTAGVGDDVWRHAVVGVDSGAVEFDRPIDGGGATMPATRTLKLLLAASPETAWPALSLAPVMVTAFALTARP